MLRRFGIVLLLGLTGVFSACAPTARMGGAPGIVEKLPPIPEREGALDINLVYPREGALKPDADSTFLFGSVGTGDAELVINGHPVSVAPNGAFLAYVPVPGDGLYTFAASADGSTDQFVFSYAAPPPSGPAVEPFEAPRRARVVGGRDTLATGSQIVHAYPDPSPGADRKWFFPPGTELIATGRAADLIRVRLTSVTDAWIDSSNVRFTDTEPVDGGPRISKRTPVSFTEDRRHVDVKIGVERAPFLILPDVNSLRIVIYGRDVPNVVPKASGYFKGATWTGLPGDSAYLHLDLSEPLWGFKAFFEEDGALVVRLRKPPAVDASDPLRGLRVMVDPGHPPGGAIGPTGLTEADANLAVSLKLADMLRERGADVVMTRTSASGLVSDSLVAMELWARVDLAVAEDVDLLVSVHNNAFPDGVNPFLHYGTETYYFHPFSAPLAEALQRHLVEVTGLPDLGAKQRSLALVRPSWMPSTLTEALFMMFPQQEAALRRPAFQEDLARAHLEGIQAFLEDVFR